MRKFNYSFVALALLVWACGGAPSTESQEPREPQAGEGVVQLPLITTSPDGQRYRLVGATFAITGSQSVNITDTTADTVSVVLPAGTYSIRIEGQWSVERVDAPGQPVQASLLSPNPMAFVLDEGQTRAVRFLFKVPGNATADVGFTVDTAGWFTGTLDFAPLPAGAEVGNSLAPLAGTSLPFVISWSTATVTRMSDMYTKELNVQTGPITVQFGGAYSELVHDRLTTALQGAPLQFRVWAGSSGAVFVSSLDLQTVAGQGEPFFLHMDSAEVPSGTLDADGFPASRPFDYEPHVYLTRQGTTPGNVEGTAQVNASAQ